MKACLDPDFALWLLPKRPGAYLLQNSFMMLIKPLTLSTYCCERSIAQSLSGKVVCTGFGEFSVYRLKTWSRTQVSAVESAWGLHSDRVMHSHGSLLALLSGPASSHCICAGSVPGSLWSKQASSLSEICLQHSLPEVSRQVMWVCTMLKLAAAT